MQKRTFASRLSLRIMAVLIVIFTIIMIVVYLITKDSMAHESEVRYESIILHTNEKIRGVLSDVYVGAINNVNMIERDLQDPDLLQKHLERMVAQNQYMSSCRLIFEPDFFPQKGHNFEIYAWRDSTGVVRGRQMTELHRDFLVHAWYQRAFESAEDDWTPPYFDRAASQQLTTTYLVHIHDSHGKKVGMLGADVSLEWLRQRHEKEDAEIHERYEQGFSEQSYSFIIDHDGTYLIHPMEERVLEMKIQDVMAASPNTIDDAMVKRMLNRESGTCHVNNDGLDCWVFYSYVKYADWTVAIVVPESIINYKGNLLANIILTVLFVGLIIIYLLSSHLIKKNMRPLSRFVTAARQVAQGNFDMELPEVKSREVDALRDAFKEMQTSLSNYVEELKETTASNVAICCRRCIRRSLSVPISISSVRW